MCARDVCARAHTQHIMPYVCPHLSDNACIYVYMYAAIARTRRMAAYIASYS